HWRKSCELARRCSNSPWNELLRLIHLRSRQYCTGQRGLRLAAIRGTRDNRERFASNPRSTAFVSKRRPPASAAGENACGAASISNGSCPGNENDSRARSKRVGERNLT